MKPALGIDLGGSHIAAALVTPDGQLRGRQSRVSPAGDGAEAVAAAVVELARAVIERSGYARLYPDGDVVSHIGLGVPSPVHPNDGRILCANNLGLYHVDLVRRLRPSFPGIFLGTINDADAAALAEYRFGSLKGHPNAMLLTLGTGIGGGFIYRGALFTGGTGYGFEPGHMNHVADGLRCSCGRHGCLEAYVSVAALRRVADAHLVLDSPLGRAAAASPDGRYTIRDLFEAEEAGDEAARLAVDEYVHHLGIGIASLVNTFGPSLIALGGGISRRGQTFYARLNREVSDQLEPRHGIPVPRVVPAALGNDAGIIGAALAADPSA